MSIRRLLTVLAIAGILVGCGQADGTLESETLAGLTFTGPPSGLPVTVRDSTATTSTITSSERIVPINGDLTEVVYALGLGGSVVARDLSATYPPEVADVPVIGYQRSISPEPIAAFEPTVVLANTLAGPQSAIGQLRAIAPTVVLDYPDTVDGPPEKIRAVARALGVPERGDQLATTVRDEIAAARELAARATDRPRVAVLYLRGPGTQTLLGFGPRIGALLTELTRDLHPGLEVPQ
ncbi:MAG: heme/hemin ABC transporter substrate-binding protein [Pseudonocardiales bacterium]